MLERLRRLERAVARTERGLVVAILAGMTILAFCQVARRQLFQTGALWADTVLRHAVLWLGFLGAALAAADEKHFGWEALAHKVGGKGRAAAQLGAALISAFLARAALKFFLDEFHEGKILVTIGSVGVPAWLFALAIPTGFILVVFHCLMRAASAWLEPR